MFEAEIFFCLLIVIILVLVWAAKVESEEKYKEQLDEFIRKKLFGKNYVEKNINDTFVLNENEELHIFGINHQKTVGVYWKFQIFENTVPVYHIDSSLDTFWSFKVANHATSDCLIILEKITFSEIIYSKRPQLIFPKIYCITK